MHLSPLLLSRHGGGPHAFMGHGYKGPLRSLRLRGLVSLGHDCRERHARARWAEICAAEDADRRRWYDESRAEVRKQPMP